jgi:hypothetical protein
MSVSTQFDMDCIRYSDDPEPAPNRRALNDSVVYKRNVIRPSTERISMKPRSCGSRSTSGTLCLGACSACAGQTERTGDQALRSARSKHVRVGASHDMRTAARRCVEV